MTDGDSTVIVMTTVDSVAAADGIAAALVEQRLAGCVQLLPITSHYRWQGSVEQAEELLLLVKTTAQRAAAVEAWLAEHHPYDLPEILRVPVAGGSAPYLAWLAAETGG